MNRVQAAADKLAPQIAALSDDARASLDKTLDVDHAEHFAYQEQQARAHATGAITTEEAQTVYIALGEVGSTTNGGWAEGTPTPMKLAVTKLVEELLTRAVIRRRVA